MINIKYIDGGNSFDFGKTAEEYAKYRDIYPEYFFEELFGYNIGTAGQQALDLGTGSGVIPRSMAKYGAEWTGADISEKQIAQARNLTAASGAEISYIVCPADSIPVPDGSFNAVTACQCFWYFPKETSIPEIKRVLKPGGRFAVLYMIHLPAESGIVRMSDELVLKYNPAWTGGDFKRVKPEPPEWLGDSFKVFELREYVRDVGFTREGWCGRMRSCRGVGATLPPEQVAQYGKDLYAALSETAGETFMIPHQFIFEIYDVLK